VKLAVSSIAWTNEEEPEVGQLLNKLGVRFVEIAPTKKWERPIDASQAEIDEYLDFWREHGIDVVAFQSMLFNRPEMQIFEDEALREETRTYLEDFTGLAPRFGAVPLVFGSPKNRKRGDLSEEEAMAVAVPFFRSIGERAEKEGSVFCFEPNPTDYNCDFVTDAHGGIELVRAVDSPGFGLHLDLAGMILAGDDISSSIRDSSGILRHFHISAPFLEDITQVEESKHKQAASALKEIGYDGLVSIEMKPGEGNLDRTERAVNLAQKIYSS
jgi:sugar phosphate isomerase/epimerase